MRELKDSTILWVGKIPYAWGINRIAPFASEVKCLNQDCKETNALQFKMGTIISKSNGDSKYHPETLETYNVVKEGDIIINGLNLLFDVISQRVGICKENGVITSAYLALHPQGINKYYLTYLMKAYDNCKVFHGMGRGLRATLCYDEVKRMLIPVPALSEQQRIADFLDRKCADIDNVLEKTKESIEEYRKLKQSVITKTIYHEDCSLSKLKYYGSFVNGYAFKSDSFKDAGTRVIKIANIQTGTLSWEDESFVDNSLYDQLTSFQVHKGDVVFALTRPIISGGIKTAIVDTEEKLLLNQRNAMFIGSKSLNNRYLYYTMQSQPFIKEFKLHIDLTGLQPNISTNSIANIAIPYRTILEQDSVVSYLDRKCAEIDSLINNKEKFIVELEAYRKSLIYEYVTGKKEVVS